MSEIKRYKRSKGCEPLKTGDMSEILDMAIDTAIKRMGRPAEYPPTRSGLDAFANRTIDYFEHLNGINANPDIDRKLIPDIESWAMYLGITRQTIWSYEKRGGEWSGTIAYFKNTIAACKKQLALSGKIPPVIAIFDMTNNHNYVNTSNFQITNQIEEERIPEQYRLTADLEKNGLVWDADSKEFVPIAEVEQ